MNSLKLYKTPNKNELTRSNLILEDIININSFNIEKILKSRFLSLNNKIFFNIKGDKLICKLNLIDKKLKKLSLEDDKGEIKSALVFEYKGGCYYIDSINSYDNQRGNGRLILDLFMKVAKGKNIFLQDNAYARDSNDEYLFIRLKNFYRKRGFKKSKIGEFQRCNVLFKGNVNEGRMYYKYF